MPREQEILGDRDGCVQLQKTHGVRNGAGIRRKREHRPKKYGGGGVPGAIIGKTKIPPAGPLIPSVSKTKRGASTFHRPGGK
mmetsp:Transcript_4657/g.9846  ORF Transcript_4657/g.9846 Transcript_4657/m.9846 type:complete len:82 (+) Transcript_4657:204-449(+)